MYGSQLLCIMAVRGVECVRKRVQLRRDRDMRDIILITDQEDAL
jgi:hypothetical protein